MADPDQKSAAPSGILLIDKPVGMSSGAVVYGLRRKLQTRAIGHAGTLDPLASGLLILLVGAATKLFPKFSGLDKVYDGEFRLGMITDTDDREGKILEERSTAAIDRTAIERLLPQFMGPQRQVPPQFSAKKIGGIAAYRKARRGIISDLAPVDIEIGRLEIRHWSDPILAVTVGCSKGTYIRSLARDFGSALGCGAHLWNLRRLSIGPFQLADALPYEALAEEPLEALVQKLRDF